MFTTELQYVVVRYMLNELGDEAANVGLVAATADPPRVFIRYIDDPGTKSRDDARVRGDVVARFQSLANAEINRIRSNEPPSALPRTLFDRLRDLSGNLVRVSLPRSVLTNDVETEVGLLFDQLIAPRSRRSAPRELGPRDPLARIRKEATTALVKAVRIGYGPLDRKRFTHHCQVRGAVHNSIFDLAVVSGSKKKQQQHLFHHLLVLPDPEESFSQAAALLWRWEDVCKANHYERDLTVVPYWRAGPHQQNLREASRAFRKEGVTVTKLGDLPKLVEKRYGQGKLLV